MSDTSLQILANCAPDTKVDGKTLCGGSETQTNCHPFPAVTVSAEFNTGWIAWTTL